MHNIITVQLYSLEDIARKLPIKILAIASGNVLNLIASIHDLILVIGLYGEWLLVSGKNRHRPAIHN
jgi:hypothetical protein